MVVDTEMPARALGLVGTAGAAVDHHGANSFGAPAAYVDGGRASCSEMVLDLFDVLGVSPDAGEATLPLAGILGDTRFLELATPATMAAVSRLEPPADRASAERLAKGSFSADRKTLAGVERVGPVAGCCVSYDRMAELGVDDCELDGVELVLEGLHPDAELLVVVREARRLECRVLL